MLMQYNNEDIHYRIYSLKPYRLQGSFSYDGKKPFAFVDSPEGTLHEGKVQSLGFGNVTFKWEMFYEVDGNKIVIASNEQNIVALPFWDIKATVCIRDDGTIVRLRSTEFLDYTISVNGKEPFEALDGEYFHPNKTPGETIELLVVGKNRKGEYRDLRVDTFTLPLLTRWEEYHQIILEACETMKGGPNQLVLQVLKDLNVSDHIKHRLIEIAMKELGLANSARDFIVRAAILLRYCDLNYDTPDCNLQLQRSHKEEILSRAIAIARERLAYVLQERIATLRLDTETYGFSIIGDRVLINERKWDFSEALDATSR